MHRESVPVQRVSSLLPDPTFNVIPANDRNSNHTTCFELELNEHQRQVR